MKPFRSIVCILLVIVMGILSPASVIAAGPKYIADVMVYVADSFEEAKAGLADLGYEIVADSNLNATLSTGVYLGYQTTDNPDEALTDIAAMNMLGNYSYGDYEKLMTKYHAIVSNTVRNFETAVAEFQTNFANGVPEAQMAYDAVNMYYDDDSRKLMGDYLLDYDFSESAFSQLTDTLMQANSEIVMIIMQTVSMAVDPEKTTLLDRFSVSSSDKLLESYMGAYLSVAEAQRAMESDYSAVADSLRAWWNDFYNYLCEIEDEKLEKDADGYYVPKKDIMDVESGIHTENLGDLPEEDRAYLTAFSDVTELAMLRRTAEDISLYLLLAGTTYGDGTALDFFKRPLEEVETIELYTFAASMSTAQRSQLEILGIRNTLIGGCADLDETAEETQDAVDGNAEDTAAFEPVSIFEGVDRSVFEDGVAVTGRAEQHERQTGENFLSELTGLNLNKTQLGIGIVVASVVTLGTLTAGFVMRALEKSYKAPFKGAYEVAVKDFERAQAYLNDSVEVLDSFKELSFDTERLAEAERTYSGAQAEYRVAKSHLERQQALYENAGKNAGLVKCASFIMFAIALAIDIVLIVSFFTTTEPEEEKIPHHLVSIADTEYGEDYVYYATVKNQNGEPADVNNHEGNKNIGWLVLYKTHEKSAGEPILVKNLRVQVGGSNVDEDGAFVHLFDQFGAVNLTSPNYTGENDSVNGTYILFSRDANAFAGSALSGGIAALCVVGGLVVGLVGGMLLNGQRKKKNLPAKI